MSLARIANLFLPLTHLSGIGGKRLEAYKRLGCQNIRDLIYHFPSGVIDRSFSPALSSAPSGAVITHAVTVNSMSAPSSYKSRRPFKILCSNDSGALEILYFHLTPSIIEKNFIIGQRVVVSGKADWVNGNLQMSHPDIVVPMHHFHNVTGIEPVYPLTFALNNRLLAKTIKDALSYVPNLPEWISPKLLKKYKWNSWSESIWRAHHPKNLDDISPTSKSLERLAYDELYAQQISLQLARTQVKRPTKNAAEFSGELVVKLKESLPFELTSHQLKAIDEISEDQRSKTRMFRLLQGDVGSGKTLVAFCGLLNATESGKQSTLMVPTEILARQHYKVLSELGEKIGVRVGLLISNLKPSEKRDVKAKLEMGEIDILVGTHAVFQDKVTFMNLGFAIIDEQHRFGVDQRLALSSKGEEMDILMMSATPIPRTMSMVNYGDMDISLITEKPKSRKDIETRIISVSKLKELYESINGMVEKGEKIYWVCPLIEESEEVDFANVTQRYMEISQLLPKKVGLVHGKMKSPERDIVMQKFISGEINVLVATTVIEVGVDVPDATVIVIENSERFGLSQLHQLRGRVGRGEKTSYCLLMHKANLSQQSYERLKVIKDNNDGFKIADFDLKTRGAGDVLGTRQSGLPHFRVCNLDIHSYLVADAFEAAKELVANDPKLQKPENSAAKTLVHFFEYEKQMTYINQS